MFDITKVAAADTSTLLLLNGNDEPLMGEDGKTQLSITVYGPGSSQYAVAQAKQQNRAIEKLKKRGRIEQTPLEKAKEQADQLASCTVSFNGFGHPDFPDGGPEMFKAVYADTRLGFIAEQVQRHIGDWSNFTKG